MYLLVFQAFNPLGKHSSISKVMFTLTMGRDAGLNLIYPIHLLKKYLNYGRWSIKVLLTERQGVLHTI